MNYKLSYDFDPQLNCGIIKFNDKIVLIDYNYLSFQYNYYIIDTYI